MRFLTHLFVLAGTTPLLLAGQSSGPSHTVPPPVADAARRTHAIEVNGKLDEPDWSSANPITRFVQTQPSEGVAATQRTEIRILFDDEAIYIGARMYDSLGAHGVRARLTRRDAQLELDGTGSLTSDKLTITFDAYHDHLSRARFQINPYGVLGDALGEGGSNLDDSWDPIWDGAAHIDSLGWTAELRIPLSQLGYAVPTDRTWGMQIERVVDRLNERDVWAFWRSNESGGPPRFGHLTGLDLPGHRRGVELLPYLVTRTRKSPVDAGNPFVRRTEQRFRAGTDLKAQVTPALTLNATINPDFGQVEVDPAVVNLSAFETFYPEKRPFFVQGSNAFDFGGFSCFFCHNSSSLDAFYSRRIGRAPQLGDYITARSLYADVPDASTIVGAVKVTGRVGKSNTVGILDAVTNAERARYVDTIGGPHLTQLVEPLTNYLVARARRDFRGGATQSGVIVTSVLRNMNDSVVANRLRRSATAVGADFYTATNDRMYTLFGSALVSQVSGTPEAILRTEESSAHYFQRPDRRERGDGLFTTRYDSGATGLRGYGAYLRGAKESGDWLWEAMVNVRSPGFEVNDISDLSRADYMWTNANVLRQWTRPGKWYRNATVLVGTQQQYNYDGDHTLHELHAFAGIEFLNYWSLSSFVLRLPSMLDDQITRGGVVVRSPGLNTYNASISSDGRKSIVIGTGVRYSVGTGGGHGTSRYQITPSLQVKPGSNASITFSPTLSAGTTAQQFVTNVSDPVATAFHGRRAIFSTIKQTTVSLDTRVSWTFTPTLTLETFVQPFLASGAYSNLNEFAQPRSARVNVYGHDGTSTITATHDAMGLVTGYVVDPDGAGPAAAFQFSNPDFNTRSLRGNAVLRWEYRPGSTLYLVWTHEREGDAALGDFDFRRDWGSLFRAPPTNTMQLKVSYWIGR